MDKSWIFVVLTVGAFVSVDCLQCYQCVDCSASSLTDSQLVTCTLEGLLPFNANAPQSTEIEAAGKKASMVKNDLNLELVCYSARNPDGSSSGQIVRGCGPANTCTLLELAGARDCETCNTDRCNGAFKTQHSVAALLFVALAVLFSNKSEC